MMDKHQINKQTSLAENHFSLSNSSDEDSHSDNSEEELESSSRRSLSHEHLQKDSQPKIPFHKQKYHIYEEKQKKCSLKNKEANFKNSKGRKQQRFRRSSLMRDFSYFENLEEFQFNQMQNNSLLAWRKFQNVPVAESQPLQDAQRSSRNPTFLRTTICLKTQNQNVFSLRNLQKAQGQKVEEDFPFLTQVRSALRRKSCTCKECGSLKDQKQVKTQDVPYVPTQHRKYTNIRSKISNILATPINSGGLRNQGRSFLESFSNGNQMSDTSGQVPISELRIPRSSNYLSEGFGQYMSDPNRNEQNSSERKSPKKLTQTYNITTNSKINSFEGSASQKQMLFQNTSSMLQANSPVKGKTAQSFTEKINSTKQLGNLLEKTSNKPSESQHNLKRMITVINAGPRNTDSHRQIEELVKHKMITEHNDKKEDITESNTLPLSLTSRAGELMNNTNSNQRGHGASMESLMHFRDRYLKQFKEKKGSKDMPAKEWCSYEKYTETSPRKLKIDDRASDLKLHLTHTNNSNNQDERNKQKKHHIKNKISSISVLGRDEGDSHQQILEKLKVFSQNTNSRVATHPYLKDQTKSSKTGDTATKDKQNSLPNSSFQKLLQPLGNKINTSSTMHIQAKKVNSISKKRRLLLPLSTNNQQIAQYPNIIVLHNVNNKSTPSNAKMFNNTISNDQDINTRSASSHVIVSSLHSTDLTAASNTTITSTAPVQLQAKGYYYIPPPLPPSKGHHGGKHQRKNVSLSDFSDGIKMKSSKNVNSTNKLSSQNIMISNKSTSGLPTIEASSQQKITNSQQN